MYIQTVPQYTVSTLTHGYICANLFNGGEFDRTKSTDQTASSRGAKASPTHSPNEWMRPTCWRPAAKVDPGPASRLVPAVVVQTKSALLHALHVCTTPAGMS